MHIYGFNIGIRIIPHQTIPIFSCTDSLQIKSGQYVRIQIPTHVMQQGFIRRAYDQSRRIASILTLHIDVGQRTIDLDFVDTVVRTIGLGAIIGYFQDISGSLIIRNFSIGE